MSRSVLLLTLVISFFFIFSPVITAEEDYLINVLGFGDLQVVSYSPDGSKIVSAGASGKIYVWDADSLSLIDTLEGNIYSISCLKITPDGKTIIASGPKSKKGILFWDFETGEIIKTISESVSNIIISQDGILTAGITKDSVIMVWETISGNLQYTIGSEFHNIISIDFSPNTEYIAAGCSDNTVRTFDLETGSVTDTFIGHNGPVTAIDISELGAFMATGSADSTVKLWDFGKGIDYAKMEGFYGPIKKVVFSELNEIVYISCHEGSSVYLHSTKTGNSIDKISESRGYNSDYSLSYDFKKLIMGNKWHGIQQLESVSPDKISASLYYSGWIDDLAFSPDGKKLATCGSDSLKVYSTENFKEWKSYPYYGSHSLAFNQKSNILAADYNYDAILLDLETGEVMKSFNGSAYYIFSIGFNSDESKLLTYSSGGTITLLDILTGKAIFNLYHHGPFYSVAEFSPDSKSFAAGLNTSKIGLWDTNTGELIKSFRSKNKDIYSIVFHPGGKILATSGYGPFIEFWDIDSGNLIKDIQAHYGASFSIKYNKDGSMLLSGGDSTMKLWDPNSGNCIHTFDDHLGWVNSVAFSPDGQILASGSEDGTVRIYRVPPPVSVADGEGSKASVSNINVYPNPASNSFIVNYAIQASGESSLTIRDLNSKIVRTIFSKKFLDAGSYSETVDATPLSPGMYYIFLTSPDGSESSGVIIIK